MLTSTTMQVPLLDLKQQHAALRGELLAAIERVFDSQQFISAKTCGCSKPN